MDRSTLSQRTSLLREEPTHLVSLNEQGMSGLAEYLLEANQRLSGSVEWESEVARRLSKRGVQIHEGHSPSSVPHWAKRLVYPPGVSRTHPERLKAFQLGMEQVSLVGALRETLARTNAITVFGHRVARVAATMIGWILTQAGHDPTLILGAEIPRRQGHGRSGQGPFSVVDLPEALWGDPHLPEKTQLALVLDVDYSSLASQAALLSLARSLSPSALLLGFSQSRMLQEMAQVTPARVERISLDLDEITEWWGADLRANRGRFRFRAFRHGEFRLELGLSCPGKRYVEGAMAAIAASHALEVEDCVTRESLEEYLGASRAFDHRGTYRGVTLIDDDATEPSDVAETLALARMVFGRRRLWAVYAPASATEVPVACLAPADRVMLLGDTATAGSPCCDDGSDRWLRRAADREEALRNLDQLLEPGDVLVTLGSGDMGTIADAFIRRLPSDRQG